MLSMSKHKLCASENLAVLGQMMRRFYKLNPKITQFLKYYHQKKILRNHLLMKEVTSSTEIISPILKLRII